MLRGVCRALQTWDVDFLELWIQQHAADAAAMGKPFIIEEFGKEVHLESGAQANITSIRGPFYRKVYQQLQESLANDGALKGTFTDCMVVFKYLLFKVFSQIMWWYLSVCS